MEDESLTLTGDLNVSDVEWIVQYQIADPFKFLFRIKDPEITIRDLSGRTVLQRSFFKEPNQKIDVRSLPKGPYVIAVVTDNEVVYYQRILKD